jgi:hypothetical protein
MTLDYRVLIEQMSTVQRLVHLAARFDSVDEERIRADLLGVRRKAYNDELTLQASKVGCPGLVGRLGNGDILSALNDLGKRDAASIVNTYNYYLALEIIRAGQANPRGNRYYYAAKVTAWHPTYWIPKEEQITQFADMSARAMAQQDFYQYNGGIMGSAKLEPRKAVCPVCQGWIDRGAIPLRTALQYPPPYHPSCPHYFQITAKHIAKEDCPLLWMGS